MTDRNPILPLFVLATVFVLSACSSIKGNYYLQTKNYKEGIRSLTEELKEKPDDEEAAYYLGRFYLALNKPEQALPYLEAATITPTADSRRYFWLGIAHWGLKNPEAERQAYLTVLRRNSRHYGANLYIAHNYLDAGEWKKALSHYDRVLERNSYASSALYNRGVALKQLGQTEEMKKAFNKYLKAYPDGSQAARAVLQLNLVGDFPFRNHIIGNRSITLKTMSYEEDGTTPDSDSRESLEFLAHILTKNPNLKIHVVSYADGDQEKAKARSRAIREVILESGDDSGVALDRTRVLLSWFGEAEKWTAADVEHRLKNSANFITAVD